MSTLSIDQITPHLGAYVNISADHLMDEGIPEKCLQALNQYGVLVFPKLFADDEALVAFTNTMGDMEAIRSGVSGSKANELGIYVVSLDKDDKTQYEYVAGNDYWHMDGTSYNVPGKATALKCEEPPSSGGDTEFANLFAAYDALSEERKEQLKNLRVVHCLEAVGKKMYEKPLEEDYVRWNKFFPPTEHPLVWKQQDGRTSMVIGSTALRIVGMSDEEGYALLQELMDWCTQEKFTYRHKWNKGDLVIWNNPGLLHRSHPYSKESGRKMHRTTVKGSEPIQQNV